MYYKVKIKKVPQARMGYQVQGALKNDYTGLGGADLKTDMNRDSKRSTSSIKRVKDRSEANLEAEGGETVLGDINFDGFPEHYTIKGPRHAQGGVPLKLPEDTFIFSDFREMKIKDPDILAKFGKAVAKAGKQKAYTPAELAKQYDINHYRQILEDSDSDKIDRKTAELMIRNYNMKLGALALAQESKKGFPQGIPMVAKPFMEANGLSEEDFIPQEEEAMAAENAEMPQDEMGESGQEQTMEGPEEAPMQMPNGAPVAMPQPEMQQEAPMQPPMPMGRYGFEYPAYAYGGNATRMNLLPEAQEGDGGKKKLPNRTALDKKRLEENKNRTYNKTKEGEGWHQLENGEWGRGTRGGVDVNTHKGSNVQGGPGYTEQDVCAWMKDKNSDWYGATAQQMVDEGVAHPSFLGFLKGCEVVDEEMEYYKEDGSGQECVCTDANGNEVKTPLDKDGKCPCEEEVKKCYCVDDATGQKTEVPCNSDGTAPDCPGGSSSSGGAGTSMGSTRPEYWLQDMRNLSNANFDRNRLKKYLGWTPQADLEEGRPYWLDPTRKYAALGEGASSLAQGNAAFVGAQGTAARNAATWSGILSGLGDIGSGIDNQNAMMANDWDKNKTAIRNQENMLRANTLTEDYKGNVIANQAFDNSLTALNDNTTLAMNTADTNAMKTDAMNQLHPNYKVRPGVGGKMEYVPVQRDPNPIKPEDEIAYAQQLKGSGLDPEVQKVMMQNYLKGSSGGQSVSADPNMVAEMYSRAGGQIFKHGGYIYTVFPMLM